MDYYRVQLLRLMSRPYGKNLSYDDLRSISDSDILDGYNLYLNYSRVSGLLTGVVAAHFVSVYYLTDSNYMELLLGIDSDANHLFVSIAIALFWIGIIFAIGRPAYRWRKRIVGR